LHFSWLDAIESIISEACVWIKGFVVSILVLKIFWIFVAVLGIIDAGIIFFVVVGIVSKSVVGILFISVVGIKFFVVVTGIVSKAVVWILFISVVGIKFFEVVGICVEIEIAKDVFGLGRAVEGIGFIKVVGTGGVKLRHSLEVIFN